MWEYRSCTPSDTSQEALSTPTTAPDALSPEPQQTIGDMLKTLRSLVESETLLCFNGVFPVESQDLILYYRKEDGQCGYVYFRQPTPESLDALSAACDMATFGCNKESVLDESYRKAGKMDIEYFAMHFNPVTCGLLPSIRDLLLEGKPAFQEIRAELYKLNVYGPGSFFKMHKDTPREADMFGSLVIILPTPHVGGSLHFRHGSSEQTFDSAAAVRDATTPRVGFAAFFSDLDHEVLPVESGFRVTLTYNLYFGGPSTEPYEAAGQSLGEAAMAKALKDIVSDSHFLPYGGYLGFGLYHEYACGPYQALSYLKGTDSLLAKVAREMSLVPRIKYVYESAGNLPDGFVLCNEPPSIRVITEDFNECEWAFRDVEGELFDVGDPNYEYDEDEGGLPVVDVVWATPKKVENVNNQDSITYAAYGNEPDVGYMYGTMCLVVEIPEPSERRGLIADRTASEVVSGLHESSTAPAGQLEDTGKDLKVEDTAEKREEDEGDLCD